MYIDLVDEGGGAILRYESDHVPTIGETITRLRPTKKVWKVTGADSLINQRLLGLEECYLSLITLSVIET